MSAHHGPPCGHTRLGSCPGCGGPEPLREHGGSLYIDTAHGLIKLTSDPTVPRSEVRMEPVLGPLTSAALKLKAQQEAAKLGERLQELQRLSAAAVQRDLDAMVAELDKHRHSPMLPIDWGLLKKAPATPGRKWVEPVQYQPFAGVDRSAAPEKLSGAALAKPPTVQTPWMRADGPSPDPLDVEHDGVVLRKLLEIDARRRDERNPYRTLTPAQRAAVSAHWSAELRAKVAASAAADKAREPSVVVDLEDW